MQVVYIDSSNVNDTSNLVDMITFPEFIAKWTNKTCDFDGVYGTQCIDLYRYYCQEVLGTPQSPTVPGAKDIWTTYDKTLFDAIPNTPDGFPQSGDILVWTGGLWGHVAICVDANKNDFHSFDANYPTGSLPHIQYHNYTNVLGWLRKKVDIIMNPLDYKLTGQDKIDLGIQEAPIDWTKTLGDQMKDLKLRYDIQKDNEEKISSLSSQVTELENTLNNNQTETKQAISDALQAKNAAEGILASTKATLADANTAIQILTDQEKEDGVRIGELEQTITNLQEEAVNSLTGWEHIKVGIKMIVSAFRKG